MDARRRPGLARCTPERDELQRLVAEILSRLVAVGRVSHRELAGWLQIPLSHAADKLSGVRPLHLGEVLLLPDRLARDVLDEASAERRARQARRAAG
jgi:hypothetical protein